jgi:hypothetical protein
MVRLFSILGVLVCASCLQAAPLCEKYLLNGKLAEGEKALEKHLADKPDDDEARFGLAFVQFFRGIEDLGKELHRYGLRTGPITGALPPLATVMPENPKPDKLTYAGSRKLIQSLVDNFNRVGATLEKVKDDKVKLKLPLGRIQLDPFGQGKPISAARLLGGMEREDESKVVSRFDVAFDRADVCWLRAYCHLLAAVGEGMLALDYKEPFESAAHRFFGKVETPYTFLTDEEPFDPLAARKKEEAKEDARSQDKAFAYYADIAACAHLSLALPIKEPERLKTALKHLEGMVKHGKQMWTFILKEDDDDLEWIPGPKQKGALNIPVTQDMIDNWLTTLDEVELLLQGKKLLPFWRGTKKDLGVNLRKAFTEPGKKFELVRWVQGTAAVPYLEKGKITDLADPRTLEKLDRVFGGYRFFGFAAWFN